jgi:hypothetical protein
LTLNATGGVGMLAVGVLGAPFIGLLQAHALNADLKKDQPALYATVKADKEKESVFGNYESVDPDKIAALPKEDQATVQAIDDSAKKGALATMAVFPCIMLVCYLILIAYFRSKGGYQALVLTGHAAHDAEFTGGTSGPSEG